MNFLALLLLLLWGGGAIPEITENPTTIDGIIYWKSTTVEGRKWAIIPPEKLPKLQGKFDNFDSSNKEETLLSDEDNKTTLEYINETLKHIAPGFRLPTHSDIYTILFTSNYDLKHDSEFESFLNENTEYEKNSLFLRSDGKLVPIDLYSYTTHLFPEDEFEVGYTNKNELFELIVISDK